MAQLAIAYILNDRWPTIKAYGLQVAKTCEAFVASGVQLVLIVPRRKRHRELRGRSVAELYSLEKQFPIHFLWSMDVSAHSIESKILFAVQQITSALVALFAALTSPGVLYTRDLISVRVLRLLRRQLFWEAHRISPQMSTHEVAVLTRSTTGIIAITHGVATELARLGYPSARICVAPDGFDPREFNELPTRDVARQQLGWSSNQRYVVYVGHLFEHKGVDVLVDASQLLQGATVVIVGGTAEDQARVKMRDSGRVVTWIPFTEHTRALLYMRAADVVVLPNRRDGGQSERYTSPMKMFEYMASGAPIVASNLPSLREVLNDENAVLVEPDSALALARGIISVVDRPQYAAQLAQRARADVQSYSWYARAQKILQFIESAIT